MKAGAIRSLTHHIKLKNLSENELKQAEKHFEVNLVTEDSFLYLSAIQGLAVIPHYDVEILIKKLKLGSGTSSKTIEKNSTISNSDKILKLKIAEVLIRIVEKRACFKPEILNLILNTISTSTEQEFTTCPDVISSGLICLGKIYSKIGGHAAGVNKFEVFDLYIRIISSFSLPVLIKHSGGVGVKKMFSKEIYLLLLHL